MFTKGGSADKKWDLILGIDMKLKKGQFYFNAFVVVVVVLSCADLIKIVMFTHTFTI